MVNSEEEPFQGDFHDIPSFSSKNFQTLPNKQSISPNKAYASQTKYDET